MNPNEARYTGPHTGEHGRRETVAEQAHRRGIQPVSSVGDMARTDVFESDNELDAFLSHVYAERHANLT